MKLTKVIRKRSAMILAVAALTLTSLFILNYVRSKMMDPLTEQSAQRAQSFPAE